MLTLPNLPQFTGSSDMSPTPVAVVREKTPSSSRLQSDNRHERPVSLKSALITRTLNNTFSKRLGEQVESAGSAACHYSQVCFVSSTHIQNARLQKGCGTVALFRSWRKARKLFGSCLPVMRSCLLCVQAAGDH